MDKKAYADDWSDVIRPAILKRDNYRCCVCGIKHRIKVYKDSKGNYVQCDEFIEQWAKANGKNVFTLFLQVAHLNHDKLDNRPENLKTLCPRHHAKHDAEHKKLLRITLRSKAKESKAAPLTAYLDQRQKLLIEIVNTVKALTGHKIELHEAEHILSIIPNNTTDEQN